MPPSRRKLPIGIQTFRKIREGDSYYYVDKTPWIQALLEEGSHFFLSRPRRFGKSLFLDTLKELFEGAEPLFRGLYIHDRWDWSVRYPVVRLSFGGGNFTEEGVLHANLMAQLDAVEARTGVASGYATAPERFGDLLKRIHDRTRRPVVVLVDEYDKPILDALAVPEVARANREYLRGVYSVIKDRDAHVRFAFLAGVSKFSKVSLFSGLNNLKDITLDARHSALCGYTDDDLDTVFAPELEGLDRERIREWYNGYNWLGERKVYNPYDILLLFDRREFDAWWFETGTPTFLVETLFERRVGSPDLARMLASSDLLSAFDVDDMATEALLFQTGYLTVVGEEELAGGAVYRLGYPNREVRQSLNRSLLRRLVRDGSGQMRNSVRLEDLAVPERYRGTRGRFPLVLREHPLPLVHEQRHCALRGLLRERRLLLLRVARARRDGRGRDQPRAAGHGGAVRRQRVPLRVQGRRDGFRGRRAGVIEGQELRGQVPRPRPAHPSCRRGVQP